MNWQFKEYGSLPSTQVTADRLARRGAPEGTVVVAGTQTAGRGRFERRWVSPRGGLYMSLVLRPPRPEPQLLTIVGALSVVDGVRKSGIEARIRWPNDVTVEGKKVAGVVGAASYQGRTPSYAILGIGVNCNLSRMSLAKVGQSSTSLMEVLGDEVDVKEVRGNILSAFERAYSLWLEGADDEILRRVAAVLTTAGKRVEFKRLGLRPQIGVGRGLSKDGSLLVRVRRRAVRLRAEGVEWLREK